MYEDPEFREELRARVEADCASGDPARMVWEDVPIARRGEPTRYISARNTPIKGTQLMISSVWDVTERKRKEEELAAQYRLLRVAGETTRFGGWSVDLDTKTVTWSDLVCDIHGMPRGYSPKVEDGIAFYAPEWREKITEVFKACAEDGIPYDQEMQIVAADGRRVWVRTAGQPIKDERGKIVRVEGAFQDISERKAYENRLQHLLQVLRAVRNVNQLITHEKTQDTLLRRACEILTETRGYRSAWIGLLSDDNGLRPVAESGIGDAFNAFVEQTKAGAVSACCRRALECNEPVVMHGTQENCKSCSLVCTYRDTAALAHALRHGKRDYGCIVVALPSEMADDEQEQELFAELADDIGYALHAMEIERARKQDEEQLRFQAHIIDNAPLIAAYHDRDLNVVWTNRAYQKATGLSLQETKGKKCYQVWNLSQPCRGCPVITAIETGEIASNELTPDNQDHWPEAQGSWLSHAAPFRDEKGNVIGAIEFATDITARKQAEAKHDKLQSQFNQAQKMESVGRLAGGVAHDFNNMLGIILGHADIILEEMDPDQPFQADLMEIKNAGERSADLTRQLLAFARKQTVAPEVIDLNQTVEGMLKMLQRLIGEDIDMAWIPGEAVWPVKIDPAQIDQILANLCVNARDAIADVGKVTIETGNKVFDEDYCKEHAGFLPGEYTLLAVSDNGCGMDTETLENIFEPFFTTKESNQGTGLGLATVYGAVKQNNGFINVYSEPGQGTTLRIYLPRHADTATETKASGPQAVERGSETVLLVEDEPAMLKMIMRMLEQAGYKVLAAGTPGEAIALAREHAGEIQLLVTDVVMPEMNGRDLAKNILSLYPGLKRLFMSGYTANVIAHHGVLDEGIHFIQKPFSKGDLAVKVREALKG